VVNSEDRGAAKPFKDDIDYLQDEARWVHARARHLGAVAAARADAEDEHVSGLSLAGEDRLDHEARAKIARLAATEDNLRSEIDARLAASRDADVLLGLDRLCNRHDLDQIDRHLLLLTMLPAMGLELAELLGGVGTFGFSICSITPELTAVVLQMELAGRIDLRQRLQPDGKLVKAVLVEVEDRPTDRVQDFWTNGVFITESAFTVITGVDGPAVPGRCAACGHTAS